MTVIQFFKDRRGGYMTDFEVLVFVVFMLIALVGGITLAVKAWP